MCEDIFHDAMEGSFTVDFETLTLCIDKGDSEDFEEECQYLEFEECQCNLHRCHWEPTPSQTDPRCWYL